MRTTNLKSLMIAVALTLLGASFTRAGEPLPSWNDGPAKQAIVSFVAKVTKAASPDFVPVPERIATFDNDGTLWVEQPMCSRLLFALDQVQTLEAEKRGDKCAECQFLFEEACAKTLSKLNARPGGFDPDSPYWIVPNALSLARRLSIDESEVTNLIAG